MTVCSINFHVNKTHLSEFLGNHSEYSLEACPFNKEHFHILKVIRIGEPK